MSYPRFAAMILLCTIVIFGVQYLDIWGLDHAFFSQMHAWTAVLIGATLALLMLAFMWRMFKNPLDNIALLLAGVTAFALSLWMVRSQATVSDLAYLRAMIPHHSTAILISARARIRDDRVRKLTDGLQATHARDIDEMRRLIDDLEKTPVPPDAPDLPSGKSAQ